MAQRSGSVQASNGGALAYGGIWSPLISPGALPHNFTRTHRPGAQSPYVCEAPALHCAHTFSQMHAHCAHTHTARKHETHTHQLCGPDMPCGLGSGIPPSSHLPQGRPLAAPTMLPRIHARAHTSHTPHTCHRAGHWQRHPCLHFCLPCAAPAAHRAR